MWMMIIDSIETNPGGAQKTNLSRFKWDKKLRTVYHKRSTVSVSVIIALNGTQTLSHNRIVQSCCVFHTEAVSIWGGMG